MYYLTIRDHMMIAHSFDGDVFGPARNLHGATYVVDVTFFRSELDTNDLVVDIGQAAALLKAVISEFDLSNLDDHSDFLGHNTTTEFMARAIFDRMKKAIADARLGPTAHDLCRMRVTLSESHIARAGYEDAL